MAVDGGKDALACRRGNIFRPAQSSGNRGDAEIQLPGEIVESHEEESANGEKDPGLDNLSARIITRCKGLHLAPRIAGRDVPGRRIWTAK